MTGKMQKPFFSIIIPVFNSADTINNCLNRVFDSEFRDFEAIVVDDGSSDKSAEISRNFNCKVIELQDNKGEGNARNKGAEIAQGRYLFFLDSDIYIEKDTLQVIYDRIKKDGFDCVSAVYDTKSLYPDVFSTFKHLYDADYTIGLKGKGNQFCCSAVAVKKEAFEKAGGFDPSYRCNADRYLSFKLHNLGYSIYHEEKAKVLHDKRYSLLRLLKTAFRRGFYSFAVYKGLGKAKNKLFGSKIGYIFGILTIPAIILTFLFFSGKIALFLLLLFYLTHYRFLSFIRRNMSFSLFIQALFVILLDNAAVMAGVAYGAFKCLKTRI